MKPIGCTTDLNTVNLITKDALNEYNLVIIQKTLVGENNCVYDVFATIANLGPISSDGESSVNSGIIPEVGRV